MVSKNITYDHRSVEARWRDYWDNSGLYKTDLNASRGRFYNLWMFPYPSGEGLHAGHAFASTGSDIYGRFMRMKGREVFQPIGYDSFGIHSENFAIKTGETPQIMLTRTTKHYEAQLRSLGHGYDWSRVLSTSDIDYYKWTQWLFVEMFKAGLAYKKKASVNYCPSCKTVLADEQVMTPKQAGKEPKDARGNRVSGTDDTRVCERCGTVVQKKELDQWFFRITDYADRLLSGLDKIDWSERVKIAQREWIGRSEGLRIQFQITNSKLQIPVWTKFWETIYGATFLVVAPEYAQNELVHLIPQENKKKVLEYIKMSLSKSEQRRKEEAKEKTGVFTGIYAVNPANGQKIPVWVTDYVLLGVGTGAVMGVPAHDKRDFEFARKFNLRLLPVVKPKDSAYRSYLMGAKDISDKDLEDIKVMLVETDKDGDKKLIIPSDSLAEYKKLIKEKLDFGFWNEVVGDTVWFCFKDKTGNTTEYILSENNMSEIAKKCSEFNNDPLEKTENLWLYLAENDWYQPLIVQENGGELINSGRFDGMSAWGEGKKKMAEWMIKESFAEWSTTYHLRDWLVSRQRYWGPPIPMIYCPKCAKEGRSWLSQNEANVRKDQTDWTHAGWYPEENLPVILPEMDNYQPLGTGKSPLASVPDFYEAKCPYCDGDATRETDVSDTFVDSAWYFLRYPSVNAESNSKLPFDPGITKKWLPVSLYFGGAEHSVLHLMYARFVTMMLYDLKLVDFEEPFPKFFAHGLMIKDGAKMSKSRGNVVNPDEYIEKYGADTLRLYTMFMGPMDGYPDFRDSGIEGMRRFINKVYKLFGEALVEEEANEVITKLHQTIKKTTEDIQGFRYNTAIASIMELVNLIQVKGTSENTLNVLARLLAPFTPHLAEELWQEVLKQSGSVHNASWPEHNPELINVDQVELVVQVDGKVRAQLMVGINHSKDRDFVFDLARREPKVVKWLEGKEVKDEIFIPEKLINFVTK